MRCRGDAYSDLLQVYTSGPFFGFAADKKGPRIITLLGAIALGTGYCGLCWAYSAATSHDTPISLIVIFSYLTGLGSSAGSTAGLNAVARIFPAETVSAMVVSTRFCSS